MTAYAMMDAPATVNDIPKVMLRREGVNQIMISTQRSISDRQMQDLYWIIAMMLENNMNLNDLIKKMQVHEIWNGSLEGIWTEDFRFDEWLAKQMKARGLNITRMAEAAGVNFQTIKYYLNGERFPTVYTFLQILKVFGMHMELRKNEVKEE